MEKIVIFGTGTHYCNHKYLMNQEWEVVKFADNNPNKIGTQFEGKEIIHPSELVNHYKDCLIVVATMQKDKVIEQLLDMGISNSRIRLINCYSLLKPEFIKTEVLPNGKTEFDMDGVKFYCKTKSDYNVAQELYDDGSYFFQQSKNNYTVIDIGMNTGIAALYFAKLKWIHDIYGFEPFQETFNQAMDNFALNDDELKTKIKAFNFGLGDKDSSKKIKYNADFSGGMSTENECLADTTDTEEIQIKQADVVIRDILSKHSQSKILLKIDCEGSEYEIFTCLYDAKILHAIDLIFLEWHDTERNAMLEKQLLDSGFTFIKNVGNDGRGFIYAFRMDV